MEKEINLQGNAQPENVGVKIKALCCTTEDL